MVCWYAAISRQITLRKYVQDSCPRRQVPQRQEEKLSLIRSSIYGFSSNCYHHKNKLFEILLMMRWDDTCCRRCYCAQLTLCARSVCCWRQRTARNSIPRRPALSYLFSRQYAEKIRWYMFVRDDDRLTTTFAALCYYIGWQVLLWLENTARDTNLQWWMIIDGCFKVCNVYLISITITTIPRLMHCWMMP